MKPMMKSALLFCASALLMAQAPAPNAATNIPAAAPAPGASNNQQPIEITATKTVEWLRNQKQYVARENVIVTQGAMSIHSDLLTADYREGATSSMEIYQLTAEGNVKIMDTNNTATGDKAVYDVINGLATLTGQNLSLVSPEQTVTATDRMEYHSNERMAKAIGNAKVVRANDTLTADTITAYFKDDNAAPKAPAPAAKSAVGGGSLDKLDADGNVVIKTPTETLHGQKGVYHASTNTAELIGKVKIERGENVLEGNRAEVNLNTNVSKLFGSEKEGGRVRGVFFPGSEKVAPKSGGKTGAAETPVVPAPFVAMPEAPAPMAVPTAPTTIPSGAPAIQAPKPIAPAAQASGAKGQ